MRVPDTVVSEGGLAGEDGVPLRARFGAIQWLIFCGVALVIAITLGTACLVLQFRDRALQVAERELNNSTLLLSRHFDQQMTDLQRIQDDVLDYMKMEGVDTKEAFGSRMSSPAVHEMLRTKLAALDASPA